LTYDGDITFNGVAHGEAIVTGDATYNTTYYDPVIPSGGVFNFSTNNWSGRIQGAIYGSDHQLITEYVFNGSASTNTNLTGDVQFNDESHLGGGIITGDAIFNTTYYDSTAPSGGVFTISTNGWSGQVVGTVYGSDDVAITEYVFNDSAFNSGTINGDVTFNGDNSSNYGTITGTKTHQQPQ
jgi:hypothetical protein